MTVLGLLHRLSRLCCMATCGLATSDRRMDSPQCLTLQFTTATTRYLGSISHPLHTATKSCTAACAVITWCSANANHNMLNVDHLCCASFCTYRLSLACHGALALAAHSGQPITNSYHVQKVKDAA